MMATTRKIRPGMLKLETPFKLKYSKCSCRIGNATCVHICSICVCFCVSVNVSRVSTWWWTEDIQPHRGQPQPAWPAEWNPVVLFSLRGEKKGEWGERKEGRMRGWQGLVSVGRQRVKRAKRVVVEGREGWVTEERQGEGEKEGWKVQLGRCAGEVPLGLVSQLSLSDTWTSADRVVTASLAQEISLGGADLWPFTSSSPPQPSLLKHPLTRFSALIFFQLCLLHPSTSSLVTQRSKNGARLIRH